MMRALLVLPLCAACGTYSMVRPANTLPKGKVELAGGFAASNLGEVNTILHAAYGITDRVEILAQNEIWNTFAEVRYGIARADDDHPIGAAVGVGGGVATTLVSAVSESGDDDSVDGAAATVSGAIGHDFGRADLTLGNRTVIFSAGYLASSTRLGLRLYAVENFGFLLEAGATAHTPTWAVGNGLILGEGSVGLFGAF